MSTIAAGVPAGATIPTQDTASKPGRVSAIAGTWGANGVRSRVATPNARRFPCCTCGQTTGMLSKIRSTLPAKRSVSAGALPRYETWVISVRVISLNNSPAKWMELPGPELQN